MSSNRGHRAGQCAPEVPRTRIRARGDLQERRTQPGDKPHPAPNTCVPGQAAASSGGQMLPAESGTLPHRPWTPMSLVNGRHRKRSAAGGWSEAEVCAEELPLRGGLCSECPGESPCGSIGKQLRVSKSGPGTPDC